MSAVNVGVIGVGAMGENHVRVYHKMEEANLIAISDVNERARSPGMGRGLAKRRRYWIRQTAKMLEL